MDVFRVVVFGIVSAILVTMIKGYRPEIAIQASVLAGITIFVFVAGKLTPVLDFIKAYANRVDVDMQYLPVLFKIVGIAYVTEFGIEICKDAGENTIASKIELAGKVLIAIMAIREITS